MSISLQLHHDTEGFAVGGYGALMVPIWWRLPEVEDLDEVERVQAGLVDAYGSSASLTMMLAKPSFSADEGVRKRAAAIAKRFDEGWIAELRHVLRCGQRAGQELEIAIGALLEHRLWIADIAASDVEAAITRGVHHHRPEPMVPRVEEALASDASDGAFPAEVLNRVRDLCGHGPA